MSRLGACVLSLMAFAPATAVSAQTFTIRPIALQGQVAPGSGGKFIHFFTPSPALNDSGECAFIAAIEGGTASSGVFLFSGGVIKPIALQGQPSPVPGATFRFFQGLSINNKDQIAFRAGLSGSSAAEGIFLYSDGQVSAIALGGQVVAGAPAPLFRFSTPAINDAGSIAFTSSSLFLFVGGGTSWIASPNGPQIFELSFPSLNSDNAIAFLERGSAGPGTGGLRGLAIGLYSKGILSRIVPRETPAPVPWEARFDTSATGGSISTFSLNNKGDLVFQAPLSVGPSREGVFRWAGGSFSALVLQKQPAPMTAGRTFSGFQEVSSNDWGAVAFAADVDNTLSSLADGVFLFDRGTITKVAVSYLIAVANAPIEEVPGTAGGHFLQFRSARLSNRGEILFWADVEGGTATNGIFLAAPLRPEKRYFAQFADGSAGDVSLFSQIYVLNLNSGKPANVLIEIYDDNGDLLVVDLDGEMLAGRKEVTIPPDGIVHLRSDGRGPLQVGSVAVSSDVKVSAVILFGGTVGTAGVQDSEALRKFVTPVRASREVNTGIALMGLDSDQVLQLELRSTQGEVLARTSIPLRARSHLAKFVTELRWDRSIDFSDFSGTLIATGSVDFAATALRVSPGQFATLPVAERR